MSRCKFVVTTVKGDRRQAPDLVERNFTAEAPDLLWAADLTLYEAFGVKFMPPLVLRYVVQHASRQQIERSHVSHHRPIPITAEAASSNIRPSARSTIILSRFSSRWLTRIPVIARNSSRPGDQCPSDISIDEASDISISDLQSDTAEESHRNPSARSTVFDGRRIDIMLSHLKSPVEAASAGSGNHLRS
jgi:hypothetical protein